MPARLFTLGLLAITAFAVDPAPNPALNVVLIMADDVGYECFGSYGSRQYKTPQLDRLADSGARFTNCFSTPLCTPSRVHLMTGKGNARNYTDFGALEPGQYTFADLFREAGYATAIAGKWQLQGGANVPGVAPADAGFDEYCLWNTALTKRPRYWTPSLEIDGGLPPFDEDDYGPDIFADFLIDFMERNREKPFFAYYPMALVHDPFLPTPDSADRASQDEQRNFEDMVAYADKLVGRIDQAIERLGLSDRTLLIFTSDNGTHKKIVSQLGERSIRGEKGRPTEAGTHVPLIVRGPAPFVKGGRVVEDLIDFSDFLPTLAEMIGASLPRKERFDGVSFAPQLRGETGSPREWLFTYYFPRPYAEQYDDAYRHPEVRYVRDKRFKLFDDGRLYDLAEDPAEKAPLDADGVPAEVGKRLRRALEDSPRHGALIPTRLHAR